MSDNPFGIDATEPELRVLSDGRWVVWWTDTRAGTPERRYAVSHDEGDTWSASQPTTILAERVAFDADPFQGMSAIEVLYGQHGDVLIAGAGHAPGVARYVVSRSTDLGLTWSPSNAVVVDFAWTSVNPADGGVYVSSPGEDRYGIFAAVEPSGGPTVLHLLSSDGGTSWNTDWIGTRPPSLLEEEREPRFHLSPTGLAAIGARLTPASKIPFVGVGAAVSTDDGWSWTAIEVLDAPDFLLPEYEVLFPAFAVPGLAFAQWRRDGTWQWSASTDDGSTWSAPQGVANLPPVDVEGRPHLYDFARLDNLWGERTMLFIDADETVFEGLGAPGYAWRFSRDLGASWVDGNMPYVESPGPGLAGMTGTPLGEGRFAALWTDERDGDASVFLNVVSTAAFEVVFGDSWDGISLQDVLDAEYGPGAIDAQRDYEGARHGDADPPWWEDERMHGVLVREIAGYRSENVLGWYREDFAMPVIDGVDDGVVFEGPVQPGATTTLEFPGGNTRFGFYLDPNGEGDAHDAPQPEKFFTNRTYNDEGPDGTGWIHAPAGGDPQCLVYDISDLRGVPTYVLAWEDLDYGSPITPTFSPDGTDADFQDLVVEVMALSPVPCLELAAAAKPVGEGIELSWDVPSVSIARIEIWRREMSARTLRAQWTGASATAQGRWVDLEGRPGKMFHYRVVAVTSVGLLRSKELGVHWPRPEHAGVRLLNLAPNPFRPSVTIEYETDGSAGARLEVYDLRGRLVRSLDAEFSLLGRKTLVWNGCDDRGQPVATGIYLLRLSTANGSIARRLTRLR